jgi:hypothetical protein
MPIEGRFYTYPELIEILGRLSKTGRVSKQYVNKVARREKWQQPAPGLFHADSVERWLSERGIKPV